MSRVDDVTTLQVGDGAGDLKNSVVGAGAEMELRHCHLQQAVGFLFEAAEHSVLLGRHARVAADTALVAESNSLHFAGSCDPLANCRGGFSRLFAGELLVIDGGNSQWGDVWPGGKPDYFKVDEF